MFNDYMWQSYLKAGGKNIVQFFEDSLSDTTSEEYVHKICELHSAVWNRVELFTQPFSNLF